MTLVVVALLSAAAGASLWLACRPTFAAPVLRRRNYRDADVAVGAGVVLVLAVLAVEAVLVLADVAGRDTPPAEMASRLLALVLALGFGLLGIFDLAAHGDDRGFRGHLTSMAKGRLTTGGIKLLGGGLLGIVVVHAAGVERLGELLLGAAVVALAANLGNLLDRAPGRATKVSLVAGLLVVLLAGTSAYHELVGMVMVLGAGAGLLVFDLNEELMLGDAGANVLGAAVGLGVVVTSGVPVQLAVLVAIAALNIISERVSFSSVIDRNRVLRALDRLGRRTVV